MGSQKMATMVCAFLLLGVACSSASSSAANDGGRQPETPDGGQEGQAASTAVPTTEDGVESEADDADDEAAATEIGAAAGANDTDNDTDNDVDDNSENDEADGATEVADTSESDSALGQLEGANATTVNLLPAEPGDNGDDVLALQERLAELGFSPGTPDSDYGRGTAAAVESFQMVIGREQTGIADSGTVLALMDYRYDGLVLAPGDEGPEVKALQERLATGPFDPGEPDSEYGTRTTQAVWALEKLAGVPVDGAWGPLDEWAWESLQDGDIGTTERSHDIRWVEVDLSDQLIKIYDPGTTTPVLISHVSSGSRIPWENEEHSGNSVTPIGEFHIYRRISGWRESSLNIGRLYNPLYFTGGIAFHGAQSVPLYPASHGCVRVPMHIADYLPDELPNGTPVHVEA